MIALAERHSARGTAASAIYELARGRYLELDLPEEPRSRKGVREENWEAMRKALADAERRVRRARPDALARNAERLADFLALKPLERRIFLLVARSLCDDNLGRFLGEVIHQGEFSPIVLIAIFCHAPLTAVQRALRADGALLESGLLVDCHDRHGPELRLRTPNRLLIAFKEARTLEEILQRLLAPAGAAEADWDDFDHLGEARDFAARLIARARQRRSKGVNVLLYGPPGTGKTEFAKVLADRLGLTLLAVGEADRAGDAPTREERQQQLRLGQRLLGGRSRTLLLFDEFEDLLTSDYVGGGRYRTSTSKVHLNRLLERNPVPTIWTTNGVEEIDPAVLRRMTFAIEFRKPPVPVRERIWARVAERHGLKLDAAQRARLAREVEDPPALVANAVRAAVLAGGSARDLELAIRATGKAVRQGRDPAPVGAEAPFDLSLAAADTDLARLTERLRGATRVSLCLSGPPGTGKSAFARHLAAAMGRPVLQKRASDLLGMYVGQSERQIADAFAEARDTGAFLVFDEADSLLASREGAERRWEVSQVNEMLTWMESHPAPFACTTNLAERLDPAAARRFTFRVAMQPLTETQRSLAFRRFFGAAPPFGLCALDRLTPGDFAVVRARAEALGLADPEALLDELRKEQLAKPGARMPMGFRA